MFTNIFCGWFCHVSGSSSDGAKLKLYAQVFKHHLGKRKKINLYKKFCIKSICNIIIVEGAMVIAMDFVQVTVFKFYM